MAFAIFIELRISVLADSPVAGFTRSLPLEFGTEMHLNFLTDGSCAIGRPHAENVVLTSWWRWAFFGFNWALHSIIIYTLASKQWDFTRASNSVPSPPTLL